MNYYERHIGDYLKDTAHLSLLEHGVYGRLLDVYYTREIGIEDADVARLIGARSKEERSALAQVLGEFFILQGGTWTHRRCDREIERFKDKQRKAKASAEARWSQTERNANASPNAMRTHSEGNAPRHQTPDTSNHSNEANASSVAAKPPRPSRKCPEAFEPDEPSAWIATNAPGVDWQTETAKFRDHTFKTAITDWDGAWRNWMRRAADMRPGVNAAARPRKSDHLMAGNIAAAQRFMETTND